MEPQDILRIRAELEAMVGARFGTLSGLLSWIIGEFRGLCKDLASFAAEHPETRSLAEGTGRDLETAARQIDEALTKLFAQTQRRAEADRGGPGPGPSA